MIKTYIADTDTLNDDQLFDYLYNKMPQARKNKADRMRFRKDRNLSLGAGVLLYCGLQKENLRTDDLIFDTHENGKPYIKDHDIKFNLSHSGTKVMCCISDKEIGCDVEKTDKRNRDIHKIAKRYFFDREYRYITDCKSEEAMTDMFFRLWTLKESFMKVTGLGMALPLKEFAVNLDGDIITVDHSINKNIYYEKEIAYDEDYKFALCSEDISDISIETIDFRTLA